MLQHSPRRRLTRALRAATFVLMTLELGGFARGAGAGPGDHKFVALRGRVVDAGGAPLADARVEAAGTREAIALTNAEGRFALTLDLGTMAELRLHPAYVSVRARLAGYRVRVAGGAPELAFEVRLGEEAGAPVMQARSNFGLIAEVLLDALAPPGDRTVVLQLRFVGGPGPERDSSVVVPEDRRSAPLVEPWLLKVAAPAPPRATAPPPPPATPPAIPRTTATPPPPAKIAAAQARRDSMWRVQRAQASARKVVSDSLRAVREAAEDSTRRARFGLPPKPPVAAAAKPPKKEPAGKPAPAFQTPKPASQPYSPTMGGPPSVGGLQRIEPRAGAASPPGSDEEPRARLEADTCRCVVRGTVEMEFRRLLTSPLRIEVSIRELPALSDTIELFMGSPRAFEMRRVPCGRWSLAIRPFSERPFGIVSPEEVAPFDCRQRALRQVRIVIAPLKSGR